MYKMTLLSGQREVNRLDFQSLGFLYSNSYFLTGITSFWDLNSSDTVLVFIDIKYYVPWIRGILNKNVRKYVSL